MMSMLCRNRIADFARWKTVFASHAAAHREAGLSLLRIWREAGDPNNIFYLFDIESVEKAQRFIGNADAARAAESSGVSDGEYHFLEDAGSY